METEKGTSGLTTWNSNHCTIARPVFKLCLESRGMIFEYWTLKSLSFQAKLEAYEGREHRQPHDLSNRDYDPGYIHSFPPAAPYPIPHSTLPSPIEPSTNVHNFRVSSIINIWGCEGDSSLHKYWLNPTHVAWLLHDCEKLTFFFNLELVFHRTAKYLWDKCSTGKKWRACLIRVEWSVCNILTTSSEASLNFSSPVVFSSVSVILIKYFMYLFFILVSCGMRPCGGKNGRETVSTSCQAVYVSS